MINDGENPKYCKGCEERFEKIGQATPCPRCKEEYPERYKPKVSLKNSLDLGFLEIVPRDGFSGNYNFEVLWMLMASWGFDDETKINIHQKAMVINNIEHEIKSNTPKKASRRK